MRSDESPLPHSAGDPEGDQDGALPASPPHHESRSLSAHFYHGLISSFTLGTRLDPSIEASGFYVPGGLAPIPPSVLDELALPATVAGARASAMVMPDARERDQPGGLAAASVSRHHGNYPHRRVRRRLPALGLRHRDQIRPSS